MEADATSVRMNGAREALSIGERLKTSGDYFSMYWDMDTKARACHLFIVLRT